MGRIKLFGLLIVAIIFYNCSNNDSNNSTIYYYSISIQTTCPGGSQKNYCVTESTRDNVLNQTTVGSACQWVTFKTINGTTKRGYFRSATQTTSNTNCTND